MNNLKVKRSFPFKIKYKLTKTKFFHPLRYLFVSPSGSDTYINVEYNYRTLDRILKYIYFCKISLSTYLSNY